jgi:hypothetical protein
MFTTRNTPTRPAAQAWPPDLDIQWQAHTAGSLHVRSARVVQGVAGQGGMSRRRGWIALPLLAAAILSLAACADYTPLATIQAMPESHLAPFPGATLRSQGSGPRQPGIEGTSGAYTIRYFGTNADIWSVYAYYQSLLQPLGWTGRDGLWTKSGYTFDITVENATDRPADYENYLVVYWEQLVEDLSVTAPPGASRPTETVSPTTSQPSASPTSIDAEHWPDGLPRSLAGQPVFRGDAIAAQVRAHSDGSEFLIGGHLRLVEPLCEHGWCHYGWYLFDAFNPLVPPYVRLVLPETYGYSPRDLTPVVLRVHVEPSPKSCAPAPTYCPPTVVLEALVWPASPGAS